MNRASRGAGTLPVLASLASFLVIAWAMWAAWDVRRTTPEVRASSEAVQRLLGRIDRLDAELTATVRLAASTGDVSWERRYDSLEFQVEASVDSLLHVAGTLRALGGDDEATEPAGDPPAPADDADPGTGPGSLAEIEREALALVRAGDPAGAWALLESPAYGAAKDGLARRKATLLARVDGAVAAAERRTDARLLAMIIAAGAGFLLLLIVWGVVVSGRDAREQRRLQAKLRRSEERLRTIMDVAPLAIVRLDRERRIQFWNPAAERIFGWHAGEVLGHPYPPSPDATESEAGAMFARGLDGESLAGVEVRCPRKDGTDVDLRLWNAVVRDETGDVVGVVGVLADVTRQHELEERVRQLQKLEAVGRLAGGVAHDFNNVMTAVRGHAELLLERLAADDPARSSIDEIRQGAERATRLTTQLLAFSRQQVLQPRVLDLAAVVGEAVPMLQRVLGESVRLEMAIGDDLGRVEADPSQVERVLINLAVNAREAMPDGGILTLRIENLDVAAPIGRADPDDPAPGPYVRVSVRDDGIGMDEATRDRAFEPFFTTKEVGDGTGLGLATVFGIVKQSGGYVRAHSEPGRGTEIEMLLPRVEKPLPQPDPAPAAAEPGPGGETVLLVEDDDAVRSLARRILQRREYNVLEAATPSDALLAVIPAHDGPIDVLVTDVVMPEMDGHELAARVTELYPGLPIIFMSGYTEDEVLRRDITTGSNVFLQKPFSPLDLTRCVRDVLDRVPR